MATQGERVGGIYYDVTLDTSKMVQAERTVAKSLDRTAKEGDRLQARFTAISAAVSAALSSIAVGALLGKVIEAQRRFDVMFASLKTMTGGAEQAGAEFERLQAFAERTPYSLEQAVQGFVKLKALGLDPSERAMTSFGNTAAAMGKDLNQMIEAVADASTSEFERLKEFGIKAKQEGDKVTLTFQGVTTTIGNNAKDITDYLIRIGEVNFADAMSARMQSLDGNISNLQDSLGGLYRTIAQAGIGEAVAAGVRKATEAIQELTASVKQGELTDYFAALKPLITAAELAVVTLAGAIAGRLVAAFVAAAAQAYATATAIGAATVAARGFTAVLSTLGGPIGIAITGLALLALNWEKVAGKATNAAEMSEEAAGRIEAALRKGGAAGGKALSSQLAEVRDEIAGIDKELANTKFPLASPEDLAKLRERRATLQKIAADIAGAMDGTRAKPTVPDDGPPSKAGGSNNTTKTGDKFDAAGYLAGLAKANLEGLALIDAQETEALRRNQALLAEKKISTQDAEKAISLIRANAAEDRAKLARDEFDAEVQQNAEERARRMEWARQEVEDEFKLQQERDRAKMDTLGIRAEGGGIEDQLALLRAQAEARIALAEEFRQRDIANEQVYTDQILAIRQRLAQQTMEIEAASRLAQYQVAQTAAGDLYSLLVRAGKERTAIAKAAFLAERAFAVAEIIMNTEVAAAKAGSQLGVFGLPLAGIIRASGYASAGMVAGLAVSDAFGGGRENGGPVSPDKFYRVGERGKPEMLVSGGKNYLLPGDGGRVVPNSGLAAGGVSVNWSIQVNNAPGISASVEVDQTERIVRIATARAEANIVGSFASNTGKAWNALKGASNVRGQM